MSFTLTRYSHHFNVTGVDHGNEDVLVAFSRTLQSYHVTKTFRGDIVSTPHKVFVERTNHPRSYRLHIEQFETFCKFIESFGYTYSIVDAGMYTPVKAKFKINKKFKPYDYQEPLVEFCCSSDYKSVITLQTGLGKTAVLLFAMGQLGVRTVLLIQPKYFARWLTDLDSKNKDAMLPLKAGSELLVVQGTAQLRSLILLAQCNELDAKVILLSAPTYFKYLSNHKTFGETDDYCKLHPVKLWELLGAGLLAIDEGHENFHAMFRTDLYTHVPKSITLSATIEPDDPFLKKMSQILYPTRLRADGGSYLRYAKLLYVPYSLDDSKGALRTSWRGRTDYSQQGFELDILKPKNRSRFNNMYAMIKYDIDNYFLKQRVDDYKLLIFFDTVEMCETVSKRLQVSYPNLKVGKYTGGTSYQVLDELEIIVATTKAADTGVDIANMQMVFSFVARSSTQSNLQMFGRLRRLKTSKVEPVFLYYYCVNIAQHVRYHDKRVELFTPRTTSVNERNTGFII